MGDPNRIETREQLRERMGQAGDAVRSKVDDHLDEFACEFISRSPFLVLSTADADGHQDASPKGDAPGFVLVEGPGSLVIPDRKGNKLLFGLENILANPKVGLLFLIPGTEVTLRVNGRAELTADPELMSRLAARGQDALLAIRVHVDESFFHCAKAFRRSALWKHEDWEPYKVPLGAQFAKRIGRADDAQLIRTVDDALEEDAATQL